MNQPDEQNQEKGLIYTSPLINLFEQKGYECKAINRDNETIYVMKSDLTKMEKSLELGPKPFVH